MSRLNPEAPPWAEDALALVDFSRVKAEWQPRDFTDMLGCGHYGCVFALPDPDVVLKVTSDPTEVAFIQRAMQIAEAGRSGEDWPEGIVKYYAIFEVEAKTFRKRKVFAIWREAAVSTGLSLSNHTIFGFNFGKLTYEQSSEIEFGRQLRQFQLHAERVQKTVRSITQRRGDEAKQRFMVKVRKLDQWAWDYVGPDDYEGSRDPYAYGKRSRLDGLHGEYKVAASLRACAIIAELMEHTYLSDLVGGALGFYLERGLLLADLHSANVGRVVRSEYGGRPDETVWVITDPGHAVELT
jgi:hypothetical protein